MDLHGNSEFVGVFLRLPRMTPAGPASMMVSVTELSAVAELCSKRLRHAHQWARTESIRLSIDDPRPVALL
ncbi:MAG TPA: hypothetical protein DDW52_08375 [Planctomycetaceae bacterium]|nr:hypothetical protein [Planctomycetaceae bacterium]